MADTTRTINIHANTWGPQGIGSQKMDVPKAFGATITDGDFEISYDVETHNVSLYYKGQQVHDFELYAEPVTVGTGSAS